MNSVKIVQHVLWLVPGQSPQRLNEFSKQFRGSETHVSATQLIIAGVIAVVVGLVLWRVARLVAMRDGRSYFSPKRLFKELCRLHGLDWPSRRLLRRLAYAHQSENPSQIFLEPGWFEAAEIPAALQPFQTRLNEIQQRLFAAESGSIQTNPTS